MQIKFISNKIIKPTALETLQNSTVKFFPLQVPLPPLSLG